MPEIGLQRACVMAVIGELVTASVAQHVRMRFEGSLASPPARSTIRAKPGRPKGAPRSDVNTKGELRLLLALKPPPNARSSSPRIGWVLGVPCLSRRTSSVAAR